MTRDGLMFINRNNRKVSAMIERGWVGVAQPDDNDKVKYEFEIMTNSSIKLGSKTL